MTTKCQVSPEHVHYALVHRALRVLDMYIHMPCSVDLDMLLFKVGSLAEYLFIAKEMQGIVGRA